MRIREIREEASERFAFLRFPTMAVYAVGYLLLFHAVLLACVMARLSLWTLLYSVPLLLAWVALLPALGYGMAGYYLKVFRYETPDCNNVFEGCKKGNYKRVALLYAEKFGLWLGLTVLLIVPGVIFALRTCMATYLLRANPKLTPTDALRTSSKVMKKHCGKYFALVLSYIGWFAVGVITAGIGFIWAVPYYDNAKAVFYKRELQGDKTTYAPGMTKKAPVQAQAAKPSQTQAAEPAQNARPQEKIDPLTGATENWQAVESLPYEPAEEENDAPQKKEEKQEPPLQDPAPAPEPVPIAEIVEEAEPIAVEAEAVAEIVEEVEPIAVEAEPIAVEPQPAPAPEPTPAPQPAPVVPPAPRVHESKPLPGGTVQSTDGRREFVRTSQDRSVPPRPTTSVRPSATQTATPVRPSAKPSASAPPSATPAHSAVPPVTKLPQESVRERLERMRQERAARKNEENNGKP